MSGFLLDTNCISELVRIQPDAAVVDWFETVDENLLHISVLTLGEIRKGLAGLTRGKRRTQLEAWLEELRARFGDRTLPVDGEIADRWGFLTADARRRGRPLAIVDGLLAATAIQHNLTVVSRNTGDFQALPVAVFNPWNQ